MESELDKSILILSLIIFSVAEVFFSSIFFVGSNDDSFQPSVVRRWKMGFECGVRKSFSSYHFEPVDLLATHDNILRKFSVGWRLTGKQHGFVVQIDDFLVNFCDFQPCEDSCRFNTIVLDFTNVTTPVVTVRKCNLIKWNIFRREQGENYILDWMKSMKGMLPLKRMLLDAVSCFEVFRLRAWGYEMEEKKMNIVSKGLYSEGNVVCNRYYRCLIIC